MKRLLLSLAALIIFNALPLSAETSAQQAESKKPSWIERLFGTKEESKEAKKATQATADQIPQEVIETDSEEEAAAAKKTKEAKKDSKDLKFSEKDKEVLEDWQKGKASWKKSKKSLPPGLQKKVDRGGELPPGWKKKLEIGTELDPEVDAVAVPLPEEIRSRLPEIPEGTEIVQVGEKIIRVIESTREIVDILDGFSLGDD